MQELVGRPVRNAAGKVIGRIEGIHAVCRDGICWIEEFELGAGAFLARFGMIHAEPRHVPWQDIDLSDLRHPRLRS